jgi:hypothetical protein
MRWILVGLAVLLAGCMSTQTRIELQVQASRTPRCEGKDACERMWADALQWVQSNSNWKMRNVTETLITTEGPLDTPQPAFQIIKYPLGNGAYEIRFSAACGNIFGCVPSILEVTASFNRALIPAPAKKPCLVVLPCPDRTMPCPIPLPCPT